MEWQSRWKPGAKQALPKLQQGVGWGFGGDGIMAWRVGEGTTLSSARSSHPCHHFRQAIHQVFLQVAVYVRLMLTKPANFNRVDCG